jgi:hypothetical protein
LLAKASCPPAHSALTHRVRQQAGSYRGSAVPFHVLIVPTLCEGMPPRTLGVHRYDAERRWRHYHAERWYDQYRRLHSNNADLWDRLQPGKHQQPQRKTAGIHKSVGAGLLAKASCPPTHSALTHRVRQQAGSYRGSALPFHVLIAATPSVAERITTQSMGTINIAACIQITRTCGTGFSREGVSRHTAKDGVSGMASSRLKPVPP